MIIKAFNKKNTKSLSDDEIIKGILLDKDFSHCVKEIYKNCFEMVEVFILKNSGSEQDAEDIFQEAIMVFVDMIKQDRFKGQSSIRTMMYSIARNMWFDSLRKSARYMVKDSFSSHETPIQEDFSQTMAWQESQQAVLEIFEALGEPCKSLLLAYYYEGLSFKDLLKRFQGRFKNEQVIRNRKSRCLKTLKQQLDDNPAISKQLKESLLMAKS